MPAPGIWFGAVAGADRNIRLGPLAYLLTRYWPLRLAEEICMRDHMIGGRPEVGLGRGVSPYELNCDTVDHAGLRDIFLDAFGRLSAALTHDTFG